MSDLPIFFHHERLANQKSIAPHEDTARHIVQVLRMQLGEYLLLTDGYGALAHCKIALVEKKKCVLDIQNIVVHPQKQPKLHLAIALTKNTARNEWLLEKATELGVASITPIITTRTERQHFRFDRFQNIIVAAMLQSQQYWLPRLCEPISFAALEYKEEQVLIAHCNDSPVRNPLKDAMAAMKDTLVLIGPEGDFTNEEVALSLQKGATGVALGNNRLRTETAAMSVCNWFYLLNSGNVI